jgi:serine protease Do
MAAPGFLAAVQGDLVAVAERARAGLVQVRDGEQGAGSGTIWEDEGMIVTNAHVARHRRVEVILPGGRRSSADVLAADPRRDLAVLRVEAHGLPGLVSGSSRSLRPGELVMAVGHPWGVEGGTTFGAVIGIGADLPENPAPGRELIAVSLQLRPGHSGGPLVDVQGRLVGICAMIAGPEVGLAIPVEVVWDFLQDRLPGSQARAA